MQLCLVIAIFHFKVMKKNIFVDRDIFYFNFLPSLKTIINIQKLLQVNIITFNPIYYLLFPFFK